MRGSKQDDENEQRAELFSDADQLMKDLRDARLLLLSESVNYSDLKDAENTINLTNDHLEIAKQESMEHQTPTMDKLLASQIQKAREVMADLKSTLDELGAVRKERMRGEKGEAKDKTNKEKRSVKMTGNETKEKDSAVMKTRDSHGYSSMFSKQKISKTNTPTNSPSNSPETLKKPGPRRR